MIRCVQLALSLTLATLLVAGCGESSMGAVALSKEAFIRQADLICLSADYYQPEELEEWREENEEALSKLAAIPYEATVATDHILPSVKGQLAELEALEPPASERKEFEAILAGFNKAVREGEKDPYSIANFWVPAQDPLAKPNKVATRYGFESCNELR